MTGPAAVRLPGNRLHLQHGPIDLIVSAEGAREAAFRAAAARFAPLLDELVAELELLRRPAASSWQKYPGGDRRRRAGAAPPEPVANGETARRMCAATAPHAAQFVTPMAAVAGAVADTVLAAMVGAAELRRAWVNNGGDIALYLAPGTTARAAIAAPGAPALGTVTIRSGDPVRGIATSGLGGRSFSLGIAESVTVLAATAAAADAAATLIANAVDLPGHPSIARAPADTLAPDSDLGDRPVVTGCGPLSRAEVATALERGAGRAHEMRRSCRIEGAALFLRGECRIVGLDEMQHRAVPVPVPA